MFGLGFWEIIVVLLVAVVLIKPGDLPKILKSLGTLYKRVGQIVRDGAKTERGSEHKRTAEKPERIGEEPDL